jgi:hypothetical protein
MTARRATFLVCDDVLVALNGKYTISGMYTGDLLIPGNEAQLGQLVIIVQAETPVEKPFRAFAIHVQFPGDPAAKILDASQAIPKTAVHAPGRTTIVIRLPFLIPQPIVRPGPIEVKVVHEDGELFAGKQWVISASQLQEALSQAATKPTIHG